ncbi:hypothetical protein [Mesorhizobium sp.]|uniref:hypothetical protein n=1 Tax=Mesorhizobium sp. TaxID=1871066 RepID=UPI0012263987|nr:hypothetical protein [Mesorhizobium sp.]TIL47987.1 MAG: hypothetical protein E5Y83_33350 [Mesorhizobium sp.]TIL85015.1 MAG: hypothetical protein E5Y73_30580 [Mesorhizobium sp.]TIR29951.1 MAG: hypothetical protein E5X35_24565 [Mesorhizobium sp.]
MWLDEFPVPADLIPERLVRLVTPMSANPGDVFVEVATHLQNDPHGAAREDLLMQMAVVKEAEGLDLGALRKCNFDVVSSSTPVADYKGAIADFVPSINGHDYVVASWGDHSFYNFYLAEKVWMSLGLSSRTVGGDHQRVIFDDLGTPEFGVAEGEASTEYEWTSKRSVFWKMRSDYLHRYLWMRGAYGVRIFYYSKLLPARADLTALLDEYGHFAHVPEDERYEMDLRRHDDGILMQIWGAAAILGPQLSNERSAEGLVWPGDDSPMTSDRANALVGGVSVLIDDRFLDRYEQDAVYDCHVVKIGDRWHTSPGYRGQWSFTECVRVGRNAIRIPMHELYEAKPGREIVHAFDHALSAEAAAAINPDQDHIVSRTDRIARHLLELGDLLADLGGRIGVDVEAEAVVHLSRERIIADQWRPYPELRRLARVAPLNMTQSAFLTRCKALNELLARMPQRPLKRMLRFCGCPANDLKELRTFRLLQALLSFLQEANARGDDWEALAGIAQEVDWRADNPAWVPLLKLNRLRNAEAHEDFGEMRAALEVMGFDTALLNGGYGLALDYVFDKCAEALSTLNCELRKLLCA